MRVLVVAPQPFFSERGTPIAVKALAQTLVEQGHVVEVLCYPFGSDLDMEGVRILRCRRMPGVHDVAIGWSLSKLLQDLALVYELLKTARRNRYQVIHAVEEAVFPALLLRPLHRSKVVYDMDSSMVDQLLQPRPRLRFLRRPLEMIENWAILRADIVVPMCEDLAEKAHRVRGDNAVFVLHDVPVAAELDPSSPAEDLRRGLSPDGLVALYVGNLERYQGIDLLLDAVSCLPDEMQLKVVVVGGNPTDTAHYRSAADSRGLSGRIDFIGQRPLGSLHQFLSQADILLSPRTQGGNTPLKIYSYMSAARPILATRLRTHTQVLDDRTAMLTDVEPRAFASGLVTLAGDPELRRKLGLAAQQRVAVRYSLDGFRAAVRAAYTALVPGPAGPVSERLS